ncbi:MAG: SDR family NAD(P)-dependent oxidoreductase, partial [Thermaerobacter sp.]|nr:SDR family NAD(P)-dependent oxidoreductase [Thermaerobacter sp.]
MTQRADFVDLFLKGQVALVTGASGGIGESAAMTLAALGADARVEPVRQRIAEQGHRVTGWECDIRSRSAIFEMVAGVEREMGPISVLVNNAGIDIPQAALEVTEQAWDDIVGTNLKGMFFCSQAVGRGMTSRRYGQIINLASEMSFVAAPPYSVYAISKAGVAQLTKALAVEWAPANVRVNALAP